MFSSCFPPARRLAGILQGPHLGALISPLGADCCIFGESRWTGTPPCLNAKSCTPQARRTAALLTIQELFLRPPSETLVFNEASGEPMHGKETKANNNQS